MDWTEINIEISADQVDEAAAIAQMVVPYGIYIEDYSDAAHRSAENCPYRPESMRSCSRRT